MLRAIVLSSLACLCVCGQESGPNAKQRARTARDLGQQGSETIPKLEPYLRDPDLNVRIEAVKALVDIGTQRSLEPLIRATRDNDPEVQIRATDGLVNFYSPGYVRTGLGASLHRAGTVIKGRWTDVNDLVIDPFVEVRQDVIEALGKLARGGASMDARANAARAAGILRGRAAVPDLLATLKSKDDQVIYESLVALRKIGDPSAGSGFAFLLHDLNEKVQIAAIEATGILQNRSALPELRNALDRSNSDKVRRAILGTMAMLPDPKDRGLYTRYFQGKDDLLRAAAAEAFARLGDRQDLPLIEKAFAEERKMNPRLSEAFALVSLGKVEMSEFSPLQYLVNTLNSKSYRGVAQPFLVELSRNQVVRNALYPALDRGSKDEKIQLAQVLARSGDPDSIPHLERLGKDPDPDVAQEGVRAMRNLRARLP